MKALPMVCLVCQARGTYYGRLVFPDEGAPPLCPNHPKGLEPQLVRPRTNRTGVLS